MTAINNYETYHGDKSKYRELKNNAKTMTENEDKKKKKVDKKPETNYNKPNHNIIERKRRRPSANKQYGTKSKT